MEDKVIKTSFAFVDTDSGEVFSKGYNRLPLGSFSSDSVKKYVESFLRGVRLNKPVAIELVLSVDDDFKPCELQISFDFDKPLKTSDFLKDVH